jgi:geranylgeranyl diphosphate synthase type 3
MEHKGFCEDLTEGKFSYPIICSILSHPEDTQLTHILKQKTQDVHIKKHALKIMEEQGALDATVERLKVLENKARTMIRELGENPKLEKTLDYLSQAYRNRKTS